MREYKKLGTEISFTLAKVSFTLGWTTYPVKKHWYRELHSNFMRALYSR